MRPEEAMQKTYPGARRRPVGVLRGMAVVLLAVSPVAWAKEPSASVRAYVEEGQQAFAKDDYARAVEAYAKAQEGDPDSAEVAYNLGVAYYKQGELAKAKKFFSTALNTRDVDLEARSKFNLGNVAYRQGLTKRSSVPEAVQLLQTAIAHYRDALDVRPEDEDARANIELAQRLIQDLQEKQKEGKEERQNRQQKSESKEEHQDQPPQSQPLTDSKQQNNQQQDNQPEENREDRGEQEDQGQGREEKAGNQEKSGEEKKPDSSAGQDNPSTPPAEQSPSADKQEEGTQTVQAKPLSREEADRLLQSVRDRERARRQRLAAQLKAERMNVKRDW